MQKEGLAEGRNVVSEELELVTLHMWALFMWCFSNCQELETTGDGQVYMPVSVMTRDKFMVISSTVHMGNLQHDTENGCHGHTRT